VHVEEDELYAAELVLRCLYRAGLPPEAHGNGKLLLRMYRLANIFDIQFCMALVAEALLALKPEQLDLGMLSAIYSPLSTIADAETLQPLMAACQKKLVDIFRDVPAVIASQELGPQFRSLPHAAVLAWLKVGMADCTGGHAKGQVFMSFH
jgi:hypothetical protein